MTNHTVFTQLQELDPVVSDATLDNQQWDEMFTDIVARPQIARRRPIWKRPTVTIPVFVALTGAAFLLTTAIAGDKVLEVRAADALRNPQALEKELARQGLDATIVEVPSEDLAGKWVHLHVDPDNDMDLDTYWLLRSMVGLIDYRFPSVQERCPLGDCARTSLLEIPGRVRGPITLVVGREPRAGEDLYWTDNFGMNELAPSGALYCYRLEEMTPERAAETLGGVGYKVSWAYETEMTTNRTDAPPPDADVVFASFRGPDEVEILTTAPERAERYKLSEGTPTTEHPRSSAPWATCG